MILHGLGDANSHNARIGMGPGSYDSGPHYVFQIALLEQVQSVDYSGEEVHVTITDGTGYTAQKVSPGISPRVARGLGMRETIFSTKMFVSGNLPGISFDF